MLNLLLEYGEREGLSAAPGYKLEPVRWLLRFLSDGTFLGVTRRGEDRSKGDLMRVPRLSQPEMKAGGSGTRHFLCDSAEVVTLLGAADEPDPKLLAKHAFFVGQLRSASGVMPVLAPLADALADEATRAEIHARFDTQNPSAKRTDTVGLVVDDHNPAILSESDAFADWYAAYRETLSKNKSVRRQRSFAGGGEVTPAKTHPKLAGLAGVGGQAAGDVLASFKQPSFRHYGFEQSENAAVSEDEAAAYRAALNHLIREGSRSLAGAKLTYWYDVQVPPELDPLHEGGLFETYDVEDRPAEDFAEVDHAVLDTAAAKAEAGGAVARLRRLLEAVQTGDRPELVRASFYALTLAANSGRVVVRDWMHSDFERVYEAVTSWVEGLAVDRLDSGPPPEPPKLERLITAPLPIRPTGQAYADWIKPVARLRDPLFREAIGLSDGRPLREAVATLLPRWRASILNGEFDAAVAGRGTDAFPNWQIARGRLYARCALLKLSLLRQGHLMEPGLKEDHPADAYHYGRLLAVLADLQRTALGDVGAGVVQRFYPRASTAPADALGPLIRLSNTHLDKISDKGLANYLQDRIAEIFAQVREPNPPQTLDAAGQSLFAMGFYQQIARMRQDMKVNAAKKQAAADTTSDDTPNLF